MIFIFDKGTFLSIPRHRFFLFRRGVGPMKAVELVNLGYTDISSVRRALARQELHVLNENAKVGVQFYEDFLEKMERREVQMIGDIVITAGKKYFQDANIDIMGSFRRGNERCGDVDILITHPKFIESVPKGAVQELVERLRDEGHISHHLTSVDPVYKAKIPLRAQDINDVLLETSKKAESYMGVFVSPLYPSKHRRIDIKFYPYRERAFASLYFTGNGWFTRAIRLFAKANKGLKLDDSGLFTLSSVEEKKMSYIGKRIEAKSEKEIFDLLGLVYKHPHERDSSDAVVPKDGSKSDFQFVVKYSDVQCDTRHSWIE